MFTRYRYIFILIISSLALYSCSDDPGSIGSNYDELIPTAEISSDSLAQSGSNDTTLINTEASSRLLLGKYKNVESSILVKFGISSSTIADSILTQFKKDSIIINSARVEMTAVYRLGSSSANLSYSVHKINNSWTITGFNVKSLPDISYSGEISNNHYTQNDTLYGFYMDASVAKDWLTSVSDTTHKNYGLYLRPQGSADLMVGFQGINTYATRPFLKLVLNITKPGKYTGKDISFLASEDIHVVKGEQYLPAGSGNLTLQGGLAQHSTLKFDLSKVPSKVMIVYAGLELNVDSLHSDFGTPNMSDSIAVRMRITTKSDKGYDSNYVYVLSRSGGKFTGDVTYYVQRWINGEANNGFILSLYNERNCADILTLFGSNYADKSRRPRLKIIYATNK